MPCTTLKRKTAIPLLNLYIDTIAMQKTVIVQNHSVKKNMPNIKTHIKSKGPPKKHSTQIY